MQTQALTLNETAWTEVLANGGDLLVSGLSGPVYLALGAAAPAGTAAGHLVEGREFHALTSLTGVPAGTKLFLRAVTGPVSVVVSR